MAPAHRRTRPTSPRPRRSSPRRAWPNGFETTLSFDLGFATVYEPTAVLIQESLPQIGIKAAHQQDAGRELARRRCSRRTCRSILNAFGGWLNYPEYFFFWTYHGQNAVFNTMSYQNPDDGQADRRGALRERPEEVRRTVVKGFVKISFADVPRIPLFQPNLDVAMQKCVAGLPVLVPPPARLPPDRRARRESTAVEAAATRGERRAARDAHALRMVGRRLAAALPGLVGVVIVTFLLTRALPGDPAAFFAGPAATPAGRRRGARAPRPRPQPAPCSSCYYVRDLARGDLGNSLTTGQPVVRDLRRAAARFARAHARAASSSPSRWPCRSASSPPRGPGRGSITCAGCVTTAGVSLPTFFTGLLARLRVLLPARLGAVAARAARRLCQPRPPPRDAAST